MRFSRLFLVCFFATALFFTNLLIGKPAYAEETENWDWIKSVNVTNKTFKFGQQINTKLTVELNPGHWIPANISNEYLHVSYLLPNLDENDQEILQNGTLYYNSTTKKFEGTILADFDYDQIGTWEIDSISAGWQPIRAYNSNVYEYSELPSYESWEDMSGGNLTLQEPSPGWLHFEDTWYFLDRNLEPVTGWLYDKGLWYYMNKNTGGMMKGWLNDQGKWYYLDPTSGYMKRGWVKVRTTWYYLDTHGVMKTGWLYSSGKWYYLKENGSMATSTWIGKYWVDSKGVWTKTK